MHSQFETELNDCVIQMTQLQKKIDRLNKDKNDYDKKQQHIEPNMKVLSNWLKKSEQVITLFQETIYSSDIDGKAKTSQAPTEFMKEYIEATYNIFQIQQNRIDELEQQISSIRDIHYIDDIMEDPRRRTG